jgi:hypothetical protein
VDPDPPVRHVSYFEADALVVRRKAAAQQSARADVDGNFAPNPPPAPQASAQRRFAQVREWTPAAGTTTSSCPANSFCGASDPCATSPGHVHATYRNFFPTHARWQFAAVRLAEDAQRLRNRRNQKPHDYRQIAQSIGVIGADDVHVAMVDSRGPRGSRGLRTERRRAGARARQIRIDVGGTGQWLRDRCAPLCQGKRTMWPADYSLVKPTTGQFTKFPVVFTGPPAGLTSKPDALLASRSSPSVISFL